MDIFHFLYCPHYFVMTSIIKSDNKKKTEKKTDKKKEG
jgi:hypothetical protein